MAGLEPLPMICRLSERCIRLLGGNPGKFTLQGTNTYVLGTGRTRILVDTGDGVPMWRANLGACLDAEDAVIGTALLTHRHHDHVGGIPDLLRLCPGVVVYKHRRRPLGIDDDDDDGMLLPAIRELRDGETFAVEGATLRAAHTPGHTTDHAVFILEEEDAMFTGDAVLGHGTAVFDDLGAYVASLGAMRTMFTGRAYPGHGPVVEDGPGRIVEYMAHRRQREEQVLAAMRSFGTAGWTPMAITTVVYRHVPGQLHDAACAGVRQILEKLRGEGSVQKSDTAEARGGAGETGEEVVWMVMAGECS